jgi:AAA+ ATPase superfamily predicted ATPase
MKKREVMFSFQAGKPVTGDQLAGREDIIKQILQLTLGGQSVVLIAPRRFGKTSVLLEVLERLKQYDVFQAYVDIFSTPTPRILAEKITESVLANKKLDSVFYKFKTNVRELLKQVQFKQVVEEFEFILDFADHKKDDFLLLNRAVDFIESFAQKFNQRIIVGFDEFGDLEKLDSSEIVKLFRAKLQLQKNTAFIFSGSYESVMNRLFFQSRSPFYRFSRVIPLAMIDADIFEQYLVEKFELLNIPVGIQTIRKILEFTGGHPYYTQLICQQIELEWKMGQKVKEGNVDYYIETVMWLELNYIEKVWEEISKSKEMVAVLLALARGQQNLYAALQAKKINVSRAIRHLKTRGTIRKVDDRYGFTDPLFLYWLRKKVLNIKPFF